MSDSAMSPYGGRQQQTTHMTNSCLYTGNKICVSGSWESFSQEFFFSLLSPSQTGQVPRSAMRRRPRFSFCEGPSFSFVSIFASAPCRLKLHDEEEVVVLSLYRCWSPREFFQGICFGLTYFMAISKRIHHINLSSSPVFPPKYDTDTLCADCSPTFYAISSSASAITQQSITVKH